MRSLGRRIQLAVPSAVAIRRSGRFPSRKIVFNPLNSMNKVGVLFVCMGNICRSPTAEGVFRQLVREAGLEHRIHIDSAGTHGYHVGEAPDPRSQRAALRRGIDLSGLRARQVASDDFVRFDWVLAMDLANLAHLQRLCPPEHGDKVRLLLSFADEVDELEVPDPYYGGASGFERVLDLVEAGGRGLLAYLRARHGF